jgi:hypothetical protein
MRLFELPAHKDLEIWGLEPDGDKEGIVVFGHIDGMYSYCWLKGAPEKIVHLFLGTPLKEVDGHYEIDAKKEGNNESQS